MSVNTALASPQYTKLRSASYSAEQLISLFSNEVIFAGQVNSDLTTPRSWASFSYFNVSVGAYTDVVVGQSLLIGTENDITQATFYGRIRLTPTNTIIYCNESSQDFNVGDYFWVINNFLPQYRLSRPSTDDPDTAVELIDYDQTFEGMLPVVLGLKTAYAGYVGSNNKLRIAFDVSASYAAQSGATISSYLYTFKSGTATVIAGSLSESIVIVDLIAGEQWGKCVVTDSGGRSQTRHFAIKVHDTGSNPPDTGFEGGSIDASFEQGFNLSIPAFTGVDDVLNNTCAIVWRNNENYGGVSGGLFGGGSATITNKALTSNVATLTTSAAHGFQAGQTVIVAGVDSTFNGTYLITSTPLTTTFTYARVHANVGSTGASGTAMVNYNNVDFVGWYQREGDTLASDPQYSVVSEATFQFTGIGSRLARLYAEKIATVNSASPTLWGEIVDLTPWRSIAHFLSRYTTVATLCDLIFDSTDDTFLFPAIPYPNGSVLECIKASANQINAYPEFASQGMISFNREVGHLSTVERAALTIVGAFDEQDATSISRDIQPNPDVGKVDSDGAVLNTTTNSTVVYTSRAPGIAQGDASGTATLSSQILAAAADTSGSVDELRQRVGDELLIVNLNEFLDVVFPDGYVGIVFVPSRAQLFTWELDTDVAGTNNVNRIVYTTDVYWTIDTVSLQFNQETGEMEVHVRFRRVTPVGDPGDNTTVNLPADGSISDSFPDLGFPAFDFEIPQWGDDGTTIDNLPPASLTTPPGKVAWFNGNELLAATTTRAFWFTNYISLTTPQFNEVTPSDLGSFEIQAVAISPFFTNTEIPAYILGADGANSAVWYTPNVAAGSVLWTKGDNITGTFTVLRVSKTNGTILIYGQGADTQTPHTYDFTVSDQGFVHEADNIPGGLGTYVAATGWDDTYGVNTSDGTDTRGVDIALDFVSPVSITQIQMTYNLTKGVVSGGINNLVTGYLSGVSQGGNTVDSSSDGDGTGKTLTFSGGPISADHVRLQVICGWRSPGGGGDPGGSCLITSAEITYGVSSGDASVAMSDDNGATWGGAIDVGTTPGAVGGFDVQRAGENSFAAADGKVFRATTLGGAYSAYYTITGGVEAACIVIPYFNWAGTKQTSATNPDIIVALTGIDGSSRSLLWIEGGATPGTVHDITPVASSSFDNANSVTVSYNHHIALFCLVSAVYKLYRTTNKGSTWTLVGTRTNPKFIRCRRNDTTGKTSGVSKGQLFLADTNTYYSSKWSSVAPSIRNMPDTSIISIETVW